MEHFKDTLAFGFGNTWAVIRYEDCNRIILDLGAHEHGSAWGIFQSIIDQMEQNTADRAAIGFDRGQVRRKLHLQQPPSRLVEESVRYSAYNLRQIQLRRAEREVACPKRGEIENGLDKLGQSDGLRLDEFKRLPGAAFQFRVTRQNELDAGLDIGEWCAQLV